MFIVVEPSAQHQHEWHIERKGVKSREVYGTAEAAQEALEAGTT